MRAVVLSGGGPLAVAWQSGLVASLAQELDLAQADFILGTSAGAWVGAQLAGGVDPQSLADALIAETGPPPGASPPPSPEAFARLPAMFAQAQTGEGSRAEVGAYALSAVTESEAAYVDRVAAALAGRDWPAAFGCVAVDVADGGFKVLTRECGATLGRGVAASCSLPGISPPVSIGRRRYMDGGLRSTVNADLAGGHDRVLVIAFQTPGPAGERMAARLAAQVDVLRRAGAAVMCVVPDAGSLEAMGPHAADFGRRPRVARAGLAQGRSIAARVSDFWLGRD